MSGLWTPDGERPAPTSPETSPENPSDGREEVLSPPSEEEAALLRELADAEQQLLGAAVEDVVANHCYGLFQLAALHLGQQPPHLRESRIAIDALGAVVDALGERLGQSAETLRDGLAQIRLAYVQIAGVMGSENGTGSESESSPID